jgi:hypothetical protein
MIEVYTIITKMDAKAHRTKDTPALELREHN